MATACVDRSLLIRSDPPGAVVLLDAERVGETPVEIPFVYGGVHEIVVYRPLRPGEPAYRPKVFYYDSERLEFDGPVLDVFADLAPFSIEDRQQIDVVLEPSDLRNRYAVDPEAYWDGVRERAEQLRTRAREAQLDARPLTEPAPASRPAAESR